MKRASYILLMICFVFGGCESFMDPETPNTTLPDYVMQSPDYFKGVLYETYKGIPSRISFEYEATTDNAVVNNEGENASRTAKGGLSVQNNPLGHVWEGNYQRLNQINWYLERMVLDKSKPIPTPVRFHIDAEVNLQYFYFTLGEAYFLRAWYHAELLKYYGGIAEDGKAYGVPLALKYLELKDELDLPRNTYIECVDRIVADCDSAYKYLPFNYSKSSGLISDGLQTDAGHASGEAALALKARTYLYAASPAYNVTKDKTLWRKAAQAAAQAIQESGNQDLLTFANYFNKNNLNNANYTNRDLFFRGSVSTNTRTYEQENFPPRALGQGKFNPSQNLVDAFPMVDGYPRGKSNNYPYDEDNMFKDRDPRLSLFVVRNGETYARITLETEIGGRDAYGSDPNATRTGYYLKKLLDGTVNNTSGSIVNTTFAPYLLTKPELYLNFAEAAIEALDDPDAKAEYGFSAREILAKVRDRALGKGKDLYLPDVTTKEDFLALVKNERRIELCFEGHRFWDIRRWSSSVTDLSVINNPVYGIYSDNEVENRSFKSPYMPLPYSELLKTKNLVNNIGWE